MITSGQSQTYGPFSRRNKVLAFVMSFIGFLFCIFTIYAAIIVMAIRKVLVISKIENALARELVQRSLRDIRQRVDALTDPTSSIRKDCRPSSRREHSASRHIHPSLANSAM